MKLLRMNLTERAYVWEVYLIAILHACLLFVVASYCHNISKRVEALERRVPITVNVSHVQAADVAPTVRGLLPPLWEASEAR